MMVINIANEFQSPDFIQKIQNFLWEEIGLHIRSVLKTCSGNGEAAQAFAAFSVNNEFLSHAQDFASHGLASRYYKHSLHSRCRAIRFISFQNYFSLNKTN